MSSSTIGDTVGARDGRDLAAPRLGHDGRRGVVDGGHDVDGAAPRGAAGVLEGVGAQAVPIHRQPLQPQVEQAGHGLETRVGQLFGQEQVAGREEGGQHGGDPVLAAGRRRARLRVAGTRPVRAIQSRAGLAIAGVAAVRRVVEERGQLARARERDERRSSDGPEAAARREGADGSGSGRRDQARRPAGSRSGPRRAPARTCRDRPRPRSGRDARLRRRRG